NSGVKVVAKEDSAKDKKESSDKKEEKRKDDNKDKDKKDKKDKDKKDDKKVKATITTDDGVVTQDIADKLGEENIIKEKEKQESLDYLDDNDYSQYIQIRK